MKTSTMLWIGAGAVAGYYLYKQKITESAQASQAQAVQSPPFAAPAAQAQAPAFVAPPPAATEPDGSVAALQTPAPTVVVVQPDDSVYDYSPGPWGQMWGSLMPMRGRRGGGHGHGHGGRR
jgi:hypothetical protein